MNIRRYLEQKVSQAMVAAGLPEGSNPAVRPSARANFGDYQANGIMGAAKKLKTNPRDLANKVLESLDLSAEAEKIEVAGPGFINIHLKPEWLASLLESDERLGIAKTDQPQTVVVDYSAPNVAKEMHVGHLRSAIIGDAMVRTLEFLGHKVIRQNHIGDWGTQFGMLIAFIEEQQAEVSEMDLSQLVKLYQAAKKRFDDDAAFATKARDYVVRLQGGDEGFRKIWKQLVDITLKQNQGVYDRLNVSLTPADACGESFYNDRLASTVSTLQEKGMAVESQGAQVVFVEEFNNKDGDPLGVIIQKSDGGYLYATTDLAAINYRTGELNVDRIIYYVDSRQAQHLESVYLIARKAGFAKPETQLQHHPFGMMMGDDGRPFKTRSGENVKLADLLDEAEVRAAKAVAEKSTDLSDEEKAAVTQAIAMGAVKYADLSKNRTSDYVFSWDSMLSFEGNTAPYMLYAYTRVCSIFRKADIEMASLTGTPSIIEPQEKTLALNLARFEEAVEILSEEGVPHMLCNYLYELAGSYMSFYEACPVNKDDVAADVKQSRLLLCKRTADTLKQGLSLLGINVVEKM
ncbi:arginine--tRNA ligase [Pelagibaculum spongiae]|uniref:Arginine--tRNA ligase n=1 Tax=Pelagibaculum spongiae TaxID=2080658 RepID=A0A2V1H2D2_9GAMM|nr:arginine--tRNA ligase [Pelagibaculum spongiae]PVZ70602.1 arginine--tRNA ligase [Pelagibaculum spongiae]